ncbi:hypothetical protein MH928_00280 [Flavobacterium sp. WW92]|uniref:hypothetical protein n=1 Tax=unclassified Flavobacterium TaxID=196869 RepID=UPI00222560DC|nr:MULTISPECIES: hypothetical protein [unclassified Flavobacterium]WDO13154.1 hypothetical protein MH928_00280 [Flavobacterium sp. WW92]
MKKIFAILALFLAFSISAVAQEGQKNPDTAAAADFAALNKVVPISKASEREIKEAFYAKHKFLTQTDLTAEQKAQISTETEAKLAELLSPEQLKKLKANRELYKKLVQ